MISNLVEYEKAQEELHFMENWLGQMQRDNPVGTRGLTKAGIRKLIARLHEELALFEGSEEAKAAANAATAKTWLSIEFADCSVEDKVTRALAEVENSSEGAIPPIVLEGLAGELVVPSL